MAKILSIETYKFHHSNVNLSNIVLVYDLYSKSIDNIFKNKRINSLFHSLLNKFISEDNNEVLLHGDLHPGNLLESDKHNYFIDLGMVSKGSPLVDFAALKMMLDYPKMYLFTKNPYGKSIRQLKKAYKLILVNYFNITNNKEYKRIHNLIKLISPIQLCNVIDEENWNKTNKSLMKLFIIFDAYKIRRKFKI